MRPGEAQGPGMGPGMGRVIGTGPSDAPLRRAMGKGQTARHSEVLERFTVPGLTAIDVGR